MRASSHHRWILGGAAAIGVASLCFASAARASTYNGNGASGFGGTLGNGSLTITQSGTDLNFTLNPSGSFTSNDVVVYIDSQAGGFADTSTFSDNADGGREAISGANTGTGNGGPTRTLVTFPTGFTADFGLGFENNTFTGLFGLASGGNNSLNFVTGSTPTSGGPYTVTIPIADLGITPGQSFNFVASLISTTAFRSNETIGATSPDVSTQGNPGFSGPVTFSSADTFTTTAVPEPVTASLLGVAGMIGLTWRRRRA